MKKLFIPGGHKCGSTTTFDLLGTSAQVFAPHTKEPHALSSDHMKDRLPMSLGLSEYNEMYSTCANEELALDASVMYSHPTDCGHVVRQIVGDDKVDPYVLICLRNPVDRAYSAWIEAFRDSPDESLDFADALEEDLAGRRSNSPVNTEYLLPGLLSQAMGEFRSAGVPATVIFLEELARDGAQVLDSALEQLGLHNVVGSTAASASHSNPGGKVWSSGRIAAIAGSSVAHRTAGALRSALPDGVYRAGKNAIANRLSEKAPAMSDDQWAKLQDYYRDEIVALEAISGRNLDHWRSR